MDGLILETKLFNLSTRGSACKILNEDTNYKSKVEYFIPNMIERDESIEYIQFSIPNAVIPVSFYSVNANNCTLYIIQNDLTYTYNFPFGNYNSNSFIAQFISLSGSNWTMALNTFNSVFTIKHKTTDFTILGTSTISSVMGFSTDLSSTGNSLTLTRCCNFMPLPRIALRCGELANTTTIGSNSSADVIITIPNNSRPNGQIYYQNSSQARLLFRHHDLSRFIVSFTDDDGNFLNFNGVSSFFTFQFDIYRKYLPKPPRFSNIVEYVNNKTFQQRYLDDQEEEQNNGYV